MATKKNTKTKKDRFNAILSFILSLGFWIPLLNIGLSLASLFLAIRALRQINLNPEKYGGMGYAIVALIISLTTFIGSVIFGVVYMYRRVTCEVVF
ncbi:hypothetical protein HQ533_02485 [Candidatus Woesearchaeota archaeon]|nr:hypothetical protein [Candidatus Woesearchaeota archaeon]